MNETPKGLRLHIGIYGRRNVGKSSLLNALTGQQVAIVSHTPGTTTDPVEKTLELAPLGPVVFIDTAGIDDEGTLGELRKERALKVLDRTDIALLVTGRRPGANTKRGLRRSWANARFLSPWSSTRMTFPPRRRTGWRPLKMPESRPCPLGRPWPGNGAHQGSPGRTGAEDWFAEPRLLGDLLPAGELAVLVVPIDLGAPKGRLILPQVQSIRDILDSDATCMVVKERELRDALARLNRKPRIVICDSQVVLKTAGDTPPDVLLTTFSILMARFKGDLVSLARGVAAIEALRPAIACSSPRPARTTPWPTTSAGSRFPAGCGNTPAGISRSPIRRARTSLRISRRTNSWSIAQPAWPIAGRCSPGSTGRKARACP
jgi:hypothetical protein